ncbi:MAG: carbohydrate ABC transporter permease [Ruminiclostridium sp.]|nr:carbohydrate ABC transporter permease [Ruminiclostridium sp.]
MFFSGGLVPYYFLIKGLGLMDSLWVYVIPQMVGLFNILLVRNFLMSLDKGLEESAFIDGAGYMTILFKIIMPLSKPVLATIALWTAVGQWNTWFDSLIFITDDRKIVLQLVIQRMLRSMLDFGRDIEAFRHVAGVNTQIYANNVRAATILVTIGPIIFTYPFLQKYFIKGIMIGSLIGRTGGDLSAGISAI